jgi:protein-disulfide isomerase
MRKLVLAVAVFAAASAHAALAQGQPPAPTPTPATQPASEVLATGAGIRITAQEIDGPIKNQIDELRKQLAEARKNEVNLQINSLLLEAEAKKRGKSTTQLLEEEIVAKVAKPTDAEAQAFYEQNKARIGGDFAQLKDQIIDFLRNEREREAAKQFADRLRAASQVVVNTPEATPPATAADRARVFATVNGRPITSAMVEDSLKPFAHSVEEQVYNLRKRQLEIRINDLLLEREAQKRQLTTRQLLDAEVAAKVRPVTDAEAEAFYNQNKDRVNGTFVQVKQQIVDYLAEQRKRELETALAVQLRQAAGVQTFLLPPVSPVYEIATDDQPSKGATTAPVTVVEFTDFQCPACAQAHPVLDRLVAEYGDRIRLVVRDYPLSQHPQAPKAAEAAEAARAQGKYWEYARLLFENQRALEVANLKEYATRVGLDRAKFDAALDSGQYAEKVQRDINDGNKVGVNGTPSIFVNGRRTSDFSYEGIKAAIEAALKEKGRG